MKKFYLVLSAACLAASATAVEREMTKVANEVALPVAQKMIAAPGKANVAAGQLAKSFNNKKGVKKAGEVENEYVFFLPSDNIWSIGMSVNGYSYGGLGFASSYGELAFYNYSTGATAYNWEYADLNDYEVVDGSAVWATKETNAKDLVLKSGVGEVLSPTLTVDYKSGAKGTYEVNASEYICGGGADYWGLNRDEASAGLFGVSSYQNSGLKNPEGYSGTSTYKTCYKVGAKEYNEYGVYTDKTSNNNWQAVLDKEFGTSVTDIMLDNFTIVQPKPASAYHITKGWGWINVTASEASQLVSYIYPIDEDGKIAENPIAMGYASVPKGELEGMLVFDYLPLDEEGNEVEGMVMIDTAVAITIEGFAGNPAIEEVCPITGFYPFSYESYDGGNSDIIKNPSMMIQFTCNVNGEAQTLYLYDRGLYYYNQKRVNGNFVDDDTLTLLSYAQFSTDAVFPYISASQETVIMPKEGGKVDLTMNALYYNIAGMIENGEYEVSAPDWVKVEFGEPDAQTYDTPVTLTVEATDKDRSGVVSVSGLGVSCNIAVTQGENAVEAIVIDNNAKYYDLSGRQVQSPEKGLYIKVKGNKAEKVIL